MPLLERQALLHQPRQGDLGRRGVVRLADGAEPRFSHLVLAAHADESLALLADPSPRERALLAATEAEKPRVRQLLVHGAVGSSSQRVRRRKPSSDECRYSGFTHNRSPAPTASPARRDARLRGDAA